MRGPGWINYMNFENLFVLIDGIQNNYGLFEFNSKSKTWKEISTRRVSTIYIPHLNDNQKYRAMKIRIQISIVPPNIDKIKERFIEIHDAALKNKMIQVNHGNGWVDEKNYNNIFSASLAYVTGKCVKIK